MNTKNATEVNKKIREMIKEKLNIAAGADEIEDEFSFGVANGFDSTSLLEFILELEDTFDIVIPDDDLIPDNFSSIIKITDYIVGLKEE
ncbi:acyl carrier protein [Ruminococcus sp.]|uniref:acyl carrier protein n=1 Tax=Ruminococcus sp. TaxID=41978 RepID=UPI00388F27DB